MAEPTANALEAGVGEETRGPKGEKMQNHFCETEEELVSIFVLAAPLRIQIHSNFYSYSR